MPLKTPENAQHPTAVMPTPLREVLFSHAFRPFFLLVGLHTVLVVAAWGLFLAGGWPSLAWPPATYRHGHELIFGFGGGPSRISC